MRNRTILFALAMLGASVGVGNGVARKNYLEDDNRDDFINNAQERIKNTLILPQSEVVGEQGKLISSVTFTHDKGVLDISYTIDVVANSPKALQKKAKLYSYKIAHYIGANYKIAHYIGANYNKEHLVSKGFVVTEKENRPVNQD